MFKVVKTVNYPGVPPDEGIFQQVGAEFTTQACNTTEEIIAAARDADALITLGTFQRFDRSVLKELKKCRLISSLGIGYEGIDIEAATEYGICVANVPDYCLEEVSDHAMALILGCARKFLQLDKAVRQGKWDSVERPAIRYGIWPPMFPLRGQTLGLIGFGRIPRTLVPKAKGFGLRIIAYDPYPSARCSL